MKKFGRAIGAYHKQSGFTLMEALVVTTVVGILTAVGLPSLTETIDRYRVNSVSEQLVSALALTRSAAIQRNGFVRIQRLEGGDCPTLGSAANWHCGWFIYFDANNNATLDAGEQTLQTFRVTNGVNVVRTDAGVGITANRWGQLGGLNATGFRLSPTVAGVASPALRIVCTNSAGRIRVVEALNCPGV